MSGDHRKAVLFVVRVRFVHNYIIIGSNPSVQEDHAVLIDLNQLRLVGFVVNPKKKKIKIIPIN